MLRSFVVLAFSTFIAGCGGGTPEASAPSTGPKAAPTTTAAIAETTSLKRSQVKRAIAQGLGVFLQHVTMDDYPAMRDGKFYGFRIKDIDPEWNVGLRPGDVVVRINGMPIEHPEEADAALRSLDKAEKLRIDFDRDGKPKAIELPIVAD